MRRCSAGVRQLGIIARELFLVARGALWQPSETTHATGSGLSSKRKGCRADPQKEAPRERGDGSIAGQDGAWLGGQVNAPPQPNAMSGGLFPHQNRMAAESPRQPFGSFVAPLEHTRRDVDADALARHPRHDERDAPPVLQRPAGLSKNSRLARAGEPRYRPRRRGRRRPAPAGEPPGGVGAIATSSALMAAADRRRLALAVLASRHSRRPLDGRRCAQPRSRRAVQPTASSPDGCHASARKQASRSGRRAAPGLAFREGQTPEHDIALSERNKNQSARPTATSPQTTAGVDVKLPLHIASAHVAVGVSDRPFLQFRPPRSMRH